MTPVDPFARPELPDPGPRTPLDPARPEIHGDGSTTYDFFSPPPRQAEEHNPYAVEPPGGRPGYAPEPLPPAAPGFAGPPVFTQSAYFPEPQDPPTMELGAPLPPRSPTPRRTWPTPGRR
ncbi:hypothetical protein GXW82_32685 [Streptacidiphilus sp. 4-A2]|nr:hypothetical protein [Streptacidiphilus sp. 4-A2]